MEKLTAYLSKQQALKGCDFSSLDIQQFTYGQSNPTYRIETACGTKLVLRK